ncbi:CotH kinase family protein [Hominiventricola filiformis]|uniref:CotH kinase family protein n=1 Tax=Hominiventricola filiformis TaxID=2885352 RepID=A0AAE3A732_9FIRM|nr:CotH kinase family protein [Hominiventricola filiformis]MCC2127127.1 CotH kinase family protein [Hominiventricola filiformis]
MEEADDIIVSQEDSFCAGDLVLKLSDAGGYPIYYTLDGSIPGFESGFYEDSLVFTATDEVRSCVLRARSYDESTGEWGDLFTRTYFYADSMETLKERFSTYIVCLTSDPYNLYDYEYGIMVEGKIRDEYVNSPEYISGKLTQPANFTQQGRDWERDAFVEILSPDGERLIAQDAGMRIFGHASRQYYYKSFKLYARKAYGNDTFAYPFFADNTHGADQKVQDAYKRLVVRAHGFDKSVTLFREELFQTLCSQIEGIDSKSVAPASVWLNGGYYNFEWLQEVYDDTYMEENYGLMQKGDYYQKVALRANKFPDDPDEKAEDIRGKEDYQKVAEYAEKNLTDDETFAELEQLVDIDNMIQYFAIETYIANWDWPLNNIKLYRYYSQNNVYGTGRQDGRWRYLYYDMEAGFNIYNEEPEDWLDIETVMEQNPLFGAVMKRPDMQEKFAKYIELCIKEYFTEDRVRAAVEKLCGERDSELAESFAYKHSIDESYTMNMDDVEQNKEVIYDFVEKRPEMMRQQIQELFGIEL